MSTGKRLALAPVVLALVAFADIPPGAFSKKECKTDADCGLSIFDSECKQQCCGLPTAGTLKWVQELQRRCPKPAVCPPCAEERATRAVCSYGDCILKVAPTKEIVARLGCKTDDDCVLVPACCKDNEQLPICLEAINKATARSRTAECKAKVCPQPSRRTANMCPRYPQWTKVACVEQLCITTK